MVFDFLFDFCRITFTNEDGTFTLDGCGDDHDWIPGIMNDPEPYLQILHYCNNENGDVVRMPLKRIFAPDSYDLGTIDLDIKEVNAANLTKN